MTNFDTGANASTNEGNSLLRTLWFETHHCKAHGVDLQGVWQRIAAQNPAHAPVQSLLGELTAASVLLAASLKMQGSLVLQIQGSGPVALVVAECNHRLGVRATVKLRGTAHDMGAAHPHDLQTLVNADGKGVFALVIDPRAGNPNAQTYQTVVPLVGHSVAECLQHYMLQSEQVPTQLCLAANAQRACGWLVQHMPNVGGHTHAHSDAHPQHIQLHHEHEPGFAHLAALLNTLDNSNSHELLNQPMDTIQQRLFWQENAQTLAQRMPQFECSCSRAKAQDTLTRLGQAEMHATLLEHNPIEVVCDFCGAKYAFAGDEVRGWF